MYPQGVCRIRKPAYAGNGCAIFLVFQTEEVGQKDGCGSQTQLRGVALCLSGQVTAQEAEGVVHGFVFQVLQGVFVPEPVDTGGEFVVAVCQLEQNG